MRQAMILTVNLFQLLDQQVEFGVFEASEIETHITNTAWSIQTTSADWTEMYNYVTQKTDYWWVFWQSMINQSKLDWTFQVQGTHLEKHHVTIGEERPFSEQEICRLQNLQPRTRGVHTEICWPDDQKIQDAEHWTADTNNRTHLFRSCSQLFPMPKTETNRLTCSWVFL